MRNLLHAEITAQAALRPDAAAIVSGGEQLTYGELEEASNRLARLLRGAGCKPGDRVCVLMPKGAAAVIAILGILKADAIWVPIDQSGSVTGMRRILASCESKWILSADTYGAILDELFGDPAFAATHFVGWLSRTKLEGTVFRPAFTWTDLAAYSSAPMHCASGPDDAVHILFTSGAADVPKGVVVTHRQILAFVRWTRRYFGMSPEDRLSWHSPLQFNLATFDIFCGLGVGAALYPVPSELGLLPHRLADFIRDSELTQWFSAPNVMSYMAGFDAVRHGDFPSVRRVFWCGNSLPTSTLMYWMQRMPHSTFTNLYAPAETAVASSYFTVPACPEREAVDIPMGRACPGTELLVLDDMLRPLPVGQTGNLYIRGVGVSAGFCRDEDNPSDAFLPDPRNDSQGDRIHRTGDLARVGSDGFVYYVGRANGQTNPRGHRIERAMSGKYEAAPA